MNSKSFPRNSGRSYQELICGKCAWNTRSNIYRIIAMMMKGNRAILLHAFQKKTQKTPRQDIEIASKGKSDTFKDTVTCERRPPPIPPTPPPHPPSPPPPPPPTPPPPTPPT